MYSESFFTQMILDTLNVINNWLKYIQLDCYCMVQKVWYILELWTTVGNIPLIRTFLCDLIYQIWKWKERNSSNVFWASVKHFLGSIYVLVKWLKACFSNKPFKSSINTITQTLFMICKKGNAIHHPSKLIFWFWC